MLCVAICMHLSVIGSDTLLLQPYVEKNALFGQVLACVLWCTINTALLNLMGQVSLPSPKGKSPWFVLIIATVNPKAEIMGISSCTVS